MPLRKSYFLWKRIFDVVLALTLMAALFPAMVLLLLVAAWETRAFPLYVQDRGVSLERERFRIYKLRTMRERDSHAHAAEIFFRPEFAGDVPRICKWFRLTGLDELPQLWNILTGDMSFIGPRPLALADLETMKRESPSFYSMRAAVTAPAGLSGLWQLYGSREDGVENLVRLDLLYEQTRSLGLDLALIAKTVPTILFAQRSDAIVGKAGDRRENSEVRIKSTEARALTLRLGTQD